MNNYFVKHELKGVLKYIGVEIRIYHPPSPTYRDRHHTNPLLTATGSVGTHHNIYN